jgi:hypothetical protein
MSGAIVLGPTGKPRLKPRHSITSLHPAAPSANINHPPATKRIPLANLPHNLSNHSNLQHKSLQHLPSQPLKPSYDALAVATQFHSWLVHDLTKEISLSALPTVLQIQSSIRSPEIAHFYSFLMARIKPAEYIAHIRGNIQLFHCKTAATTINGLDATENMKSTAVNSEIQSLQSELEASELIVEEEQRQLTERKRKLTLLGGYMAQKQREIANLAALRDKLRGIQREISPESLENSVRSTQSVVGEGISVILAENEENSKARSNKSQFAPMHHESVEKCMKLSGSRLISALQQHSSSQSTQLAAAIADFQTQSNSPKNNPNQAFPSQSTQLQQLLSHAREIQRSQYVENQKLLAEISENDRNYEELQGQLQISSENHRELLISEQNYAESSAKLAKLAELEQNYKVQSQLHRQNHEILQNQQKTIETYSEIRQTHRRKCEILLKEQKGYTKHMKLYISKLNSFISGTVVENLGQFTATLKEIKLENQESNTELAIFSSFTAQKGILMEKINVNSVENPKTNQKIAEILGIRAFHSRDSLFSAILQIIQQNFGLISAISSQEKQFLVLSSAENAKSRAETLLSQYNSYYSALKSQFPAGLGEIQRRTAFILGRTGSTREILQNFIDLPAQWTTPWLRANGKSLREWQNYLQALEKAVREEEAQEKSKKDRSALNSGQSFERD